MAGFSSETGGDSIVNADNGSFDGTSRGGALATDGQLWIGITTPDNTGLTHVNVGKVVSGLTGTISVGYISPNITLDATNAVIPYTSSVINFKNTGLTTIFTTSSTKTFIAMFYTVVVVNSTASNGDAQFNIGWTAPDYSDFILFGGVGAPITGQVVFSQISNLVGTFPPSTPIVINIVNAESGTEFLCRIQIVGVYI